MGRSSPSTQTVTQKTELDPIQKSFLFGTELPEDYRTAMEARNREIMGLSPFEPGTSFHAAGDFSEPVTPQRWRPNAPGPYQGRANGGLVTLAAGGMVPPQLPNLSDRETAYMMGLQALQGMTQPQQMGYAMGGLIEGPGTGTSDDIPATIYQNGIPVEQALLSNGEVVLSRRDLENMSPDGNADTAAQMVGNSPNGSRGQAAAEMYAMTEMFRNGGRT